MPIPTAKPAASCDLIMKGGITSGVVYPGALLELAEKYRFRSIGGSSAGAIAAAAAAAAELGRATGGFDKLARLRDDLSKPGFLLSLFRPTPATRPAFDYFLDFLQASRQPRFSAFRWLHFKVVQPFLNWQLVIALVVALPLAWWLGSLGWPPWGLSLVALLAGGALAALGILVGVLLMLRKFQRLAQALHANHFGVCPGASPDGMGLTDYLHQRFNDMAGLPAGAGPLTFGQLRANQVELCLIASNISLQRGYRFPLRDEMLLFNKDELAPFFPATVLQALAAAPPPTGFADFPQNGYHFLPRGPDLPVLVAVRLSLSFPGLFAAVPLYTLSQAFLDRRKANPQAPLAEGDVQRNYFSDGGIVSNFPIHLFDRWVPDNPTFCINLAPMPAEAMAGSRREALAVPAGLAGAKESSLAAVMPDAQAVVRPEFISRPTMQGLAQTQANLPPAGRGDEPTRQTPGLEAVYLPAADVATALEWHPQETWLDLAGAIFYTASNHRDILQSQLPSYRERIVTVRLGHQEGGLNLDMEPEVIQRLVMLGQEAGRRLGGFAFDQHRWVRLCVVAAHLERELKSMRAGLADGEALKLLAAGARPDFPFPRDDAWCATARSLFDKLLAVVNEVYPDSASAHFDDSLTPTPQPVKRLVPEE